MSDDMFVLLRYALYFVDNFGFVFAFKIIFPSLLLFYFMRQFFNLV